MWLGQAMYPNDPESQNKVGEIWNTFGEFTLSHMEAEHAAHKTLGEMEKILNRNDPEFGKPPAKLLASVRRERKEPHSDQAR